MNINTTPDSANYILPELQELKMSRLSAQTKLFAAMALATLSACHDPASTAYSRDTSFDSVNTDIISEVDSNSSDLVDSTLGDSTSLDTGTPDFDLPSCGTVLRPDFLAAMDTVEIYANKSYTVQTGQQNRFFDLPLQLQGWQRFDDAINVLVSSQGVETTTVKTTYERVAGNGERSLLQAYYQIGNGLNMAPAATRANFSSVPDNSITGNLVAFQVTTNAIQGDPMAANHQFRVVSVSNTPFYCEIKHADDSLLPICLQDCIENLAEVTGATLVQQESHPESSFFN